jgi:osmotically-inducible protein OsmY
VVLEGEVADIAAKKLALERTAAVTGVRGVIDRLRVKSAERRGDGAIRDSICAFILRQSEFGRCAVRALAKGRMESLREVPEGGSGEIEVAVADGVITLEGKVVSTSHKRVAGVLAWWTPGCRDVVNSLIVEPPQQDTDEEVVDALRLVLEIDPFVKAEQIRATCRNDIVTLEGYVRTGEERRRAEFDAWCLFAVDGVINRLEVRE